MAANTTDRYLRIWHRKGKQWKRALEVLPPEAGERLFDPFPYFCGIYLNCGGLDEPDGLEPP